MSPADSSVQDQIVTLQLPKSSACTPPVMTGDIAVIGLGCRVAGDINSPEQLWSFLLEKGDASGEIPSMRWEPYYNSDARTLKTLRQLPGRGYFLKNIEQFDASFFGTSGREAELMDPQQRIAVEVAWEALEDAGIPPQSLAGTNTAVYMGVSTDDYSRHLFGNLADIEAWTGIGTAYCGVPNRISYLLNLLGPSVAVDAACASSLVAIHHCRQALLSGETSLAIAGGVNALIVPGQYQVLSHAGAISPEGRCRSFDDTAHGYGRGEGVGIVILKRLDDAVRNQDRILAVLKGSAIGHDGRTNGIMAPNGKSQEQVARDALKAAKVEASSISYVEAHATSTAAGDPVEISAISRVYGQHGRSGKPCLVGSLKPNIGHLEAGAGALSFIKAVLAVYKSSIPPQTNLNKLNTKIDWETSGIEVLREQQDWTENNGPRRAAICSYGYGGTVSHAVIENMSHYHLPHEGLPHTSKEPALLLLSAPHHTRIALAAEALADWFAGNDSKVNLHVVATTLATRRGHHAYRTAVVVNDVEEATKVLRSISEGSSDPDCIFSSRVAPEAARGGAAWVFSGHGAHWDGMGRELLQRNAVFCETIHAIDTVIMKELGFSAVEALQTEDLGTTDRVHVLTFAMHVGLSALLKSKGVMPKAIIGHSLGQLAAAVCAGALTLHEGALIVCKKVKLLQRVMGLGAMVLVHMPFKDALKDIGSTEDIAVAIDSSPNTCVVSGKIHTVEQFSDFWFKKGISVRKVNSDVAFHSPVLRSLAKEFHEQLEGQIDPQVPDIMLYSTSVLSDPRLDVPRDAKYWVDDMINPVWLTSAVSAAAEDGFRVFLEVSSHPIICQSIEETLADCGVDDAVVIPTLIRNRQTERLIQLCMGKLHCAGVEMNLSAIFKGPWSVEVPKTRWNHQPFWKKVIMGQGSRQETHDVETHTLLGQCTSIFGTDTTIWQTKLDDTVKPYPNRHPILGTEVIPAAVLLCTFLRAGGTQSIGNVALKVPVPVMPARDIQVVLQKDRIQLSSRLATSDEANGAAQPWQAHTMCRILPTDYHSITESINITEIKQRVRKPLVPSFAVDYLASLGVTDMGFPWVVVEHLASDDEMLVCVEIAPEVTKLPWETDSLAPFLDAATSIGASIFHKQPVIRMPSHIHRLSRKRGVDVPRRGYILVKRTFTPLTVDILMTDNDGRAFAEVVAMTLSALEGTEGVSSSMESLVHQVAWPAASLTDFPASVRQIIFVGPPGELVQNYQKFLKSTSDILVTLVASPDLITSAQQREDTVVIVVPGQIDSDDHVPQFASNLCATLVATTKVVANLSPAMKLYCITNNAFEGQTPTALAQGALFGLARIIQTEHSSLWGGLLDVEDSTFPMQALKYVEDADIIRIVDGVCRIGRLRSLPKEKLWGPRPQRMCYPSMEGTYIITGGIGDLGLEVASWMVEKGARRLVLVSRRKLPPRHTWNNKATKVTKKMMEFEREGVTVHVVSVDLSVADAASKLGAALDRLALPPVQGVVHAAGILEDQLLMSSSRDAFDRVMAPKIQGAMALNELFPPNTLDFFVLFSSCSQHFQFVGSASYASGNSFLDTLAKRRRALGDNAIAFQWTGWRGLGMAANAENLDMEMQIKGITDVTSEDAFHAWDYIAKYDVDSAVIVRARSIAQGAVLPSPILADIVPRTTTSVPFESKELHSNSLPQEGPERAAYLSEVICGCVSKTLHVNVEDVDPNVALVAMGLDSVMTIQLRKHLQDVLIVKVPPTLIWGHPSVAHMVKWFREQLKERV